LISILFILDVLFPCGMYTAIDKLQLTGQNLGKVFNFRRGHLQAEQFWCYQ